MVQHLLTSIFTLHSKLRLRLIALHSKICVFSRFPFDWKNPVGYAIAVAFQCLLSLHPMRFIACFLSYGFSAFLFSISVGKDLKHDLNILNRQLKTEPFRCQILKKLIEFIDLHTSMKQLSEQKSMKIAQQKLNSYFHEFFFFFRCVSGNLIIFRKFIMPY